jgi:ABC-type transport system involved in cytochrome bd biosynthesis fused ATPase/permease subunit
MKSDEEKVIKTLKRYQRKWNDKNNTLEQELKNITDSYELKFISRMASINEENNLFSRSKLVSIILGGIGTLIGLYSKIINPSQALVFIVAGTIVYYTLISIWASHIATRNNVLREAIKVRIIELEKEFIIQNNVSVK